MKDRKLKVREGHRDYFLRQEPTKGNPTVPFILLKGNWLETAGFVVGSPVIVQVNEHRLTITPGT